MRYLTEKQVAERLGVSIPALRMWRAADRRAGLPEGKPGKGGLIWAKFGKCVRYLETGILAGEWEVTNGSSANSLR